MKCKDCVMMQIVDAAVDYSCNLADDDTAFSTARRYDDEPWMNRDCPRNDERLAKLKEQLTS